MEDFAKQSATWLETQPGLELEIGCLVAAASEWTEDEMELDDLVGGLVESGHVQLYVG